MRGKRIFDLFCTIPGLVLISPILLVISIWIKLDSSGPVFFRQQRVGRFGKPFKIYKFRTMVADADKKGTSITVAGDSRITRSGAFLRKHKLDELPQLFNVIKGEMSLVGPRPEVPKFVKYYPDPIRKIVLSVKPGITDPASILFRNENELLASTSEPEGYYTENILPEKLKYYVDYVENRNLIKDFSIILRTLKSVLLSD